jgi:hypothetical protein
MFIANFPRIIFWNPEASRRFLPLSVTARKALTYSARISSGHWPLHKMSITPLALYRYTGGRNTTVGKNITQLDGHWLRRSQINQSVIELHSRLVLRNIVWGK